MILVDSNIPMYLVGAPHPRKTDAQRLLERLISDGAKLVTDAEVFQEILHRYVAIQRRDAIQHAFDVLNSCVDDVLPVDRAVTEKAGQLVLGYSALSARDALHIAVMELHQIDAILSFDRDFASYPGIRRIG
jgi:predicted nucleic acid-binding protein